MSRKVDYIKDLNDSKETWKLPVRILDAWTVVNTVKGTEHMEMIVMDSKSNTGGKKEVVTVNLKDLKGNLINCSLWEKYGSKFMNYYNENKKSGAIVIILTHAMIIDSKGGAQYTPQEKFVFNATHMALKDICKLKEDTICVTVATTLKFHVSKHGWFYYNCTNCNIKAADPKKPYKCKCEEQVNEPIPRYKVELYVQSGDSQYRFVFWDAECADIIDKSAAQLRQTMIEEGEDDPMVYPADLDKMLNLKMALRVKIQPFYRQGSVSKLSIDEEFIKQIESVLNIDENHAPSQYVKAATSEEIALFPTNDLEISSAITPSKRRSIEELESGDCEQLGACQLSVSKPTKHVKVEPKD
ncbi:hypothetical protein TSUD_223150 [Trifolium subterraneum]|uniref:Replication factor A C-terminal domain-containing protein n=1 Tax=Trifolium subterraneum TaxID=3900 RepID=A0A2Z6M6S0_TRISU|nr:hypothetical protein TSUD_223150 [Trifolium subterraneum]